MLAPGSAPWFDMTAASGPAGVRAERFQGKWTLKLRNVNGHRHLDDAVGQQGRPRSNSASLLVSTKAARISGIVTFVFTGSLLSLVVVGKAGAV